MIPPNGVEGNRGDSRVSWSNHSSLSFINVHAHSFHSFAIVLTQLLSIQYVVSGAHVVRAPTPERLQRVQLSTRRPKKWRQNCKWKRELRLVFPSFVRSILAAEVYFSSSTENEKRFQNEWQREGRGDPELNLLIFHYIHKSHISHIYHVPHQS